MKRKHEESKKNDCLRSCPSGIVFDLRFTEEDEVKLRVQKVHPKEHFNLHVYKCLKVGRRDFGPLLDAKQAAMIFLCRNVEDRFFFFLVTSPNHVLFFKTNK